MRLKNITVRFLESLAETVESLNTESKLFSHPSLVVVSALILTGAASFSYDFKLPVAIFILSFIVVMLTRSPLLVWMKIVLFILVWAALIAVPLLLLTPGESITHFSLDLIELQVSREGVYLMITFISRVVSAASIFICFTLMMGWRGIIKGLEGLRVPKEITLLLNLSIIHIPLFIREVLKMLLAREARIMKNVGFKGIWVILATIVGDVLIRSHERAWRLERGIRARTFASTETFQKDLLNVDGGKDLSFYR